MKILYLITQAGGGGAQHYVLTLAKHFGGTIAAGGESRKLFDEAELAGIETFRLKYLKRNINPLYDLLAIFEIRRLIKKYDPQIVHLNSTKAGVLGSLATAFLFHPVKIVFTAHGFIFNEPLSPPAKWLAAAAEKTASLFRDYIICVSQTDYNSALSHKLVKKNQIATVYNGLGPINFLPKDRARESLGVPQTKLVIGSVANFYKTKGLDVLIDALALMEFNLLNKILLVIIGGGPEEKNLRLKIKNLRLDDKIALLGKIENANTYLKAFDIFVLPSRKEGLPFALLEAMQAGLPIVAASTGGMPEALGDAGFLVRPEQPRELAGVLSRIAADLNTHGPDYFSELSQKVKTRAAGFSREKMLSQTKQIYEQLTVKK